MSALPQPVIEPANNAAELRAVSGSLRLRLIPSSENSDQKIVDLLRWLLSIERKAKAAE